MYIDVLSLVIGMARLLGCFVNPVFYKQLTKITTVYRSFTDFLVRILDNNRRERGMDIRGSSSLLPHLPPYF
jgi:hypothetical protein